MSETWGDIHLNGTIAYGDYDGYIYKQPRVPISKNDLGPHTEWLAVNARNPYQNLKLSTDPEVVGAFMSWFKRRGWRPHAYEALDGKGCPNYSEAMPRQGEQE